ncbi:TPA: hypothetical protein U1C31_001119 [Streptococcus suis]|nr:hypothetical protein [Streptococcus suis]
MFSWLEAIYYTLIQLAKGNPITASLLTGFMLYLCFKGIKAIQKPVQALFQWVNRDTIKKGCQQEWKKLALLWVDRHHIDWRVVGKATGQKIWRWWIRLGLALLAFLFLVFGNLLFRLIYQLPFVKSDRKRFDKEMKPLLYFKSYSLDRGEKTTNRFKRQKKLQLDNYESRLMVSIQTRFIIVLKRNGSFSSGI